MTTFDIVHHAIESLAAHRVRSALCAIGIAAGVATVVTALAIANGAKAQAMAEIGALGIDNVLVRAESPDTTRGRVAPLLSLDDADLLQSRLPLAVVAARRSSADVIVYGSRSVPGAVLGVTPEWRRTAGLSVDEGRWISADDRRRRVAVLGAMVAARLFDHAVPIGEQVMTAGEWRTVVGVLPPSDARHGQAIEHGVSADAAVFVPFESLDVTLGSGDAGDAVSEIAIRLSAGSDLHAAAARVGQILASRHEGERAFEIVVPVELLNAKLRAQRNFHVLLLAIGTLALLISGTGITNIMAASVMERAPEIGIRRAVGAKRRTIVWQFGAEAVALSMAGAAAGIATGTGASWLVARLAHWPVDISASSLAASMALAIGVGVAAAAYPATLAARLSPIDALRE